MKEFTLYHKDFGIFVTDSSVMVDRKLSIGWNFLDEVKKVEIKEKRKYKTRKAKESEEIKEV